MKKFRTLAPAALGLVPIAILFSTGVGCEPIEPDSNRLLILGMGLGSLVLSPVLMYLFTLLLSLGLTPQEMADLVKPPPAKAKTTVTPNYN